MAFWQLKSAPNSFSAGAPPGTPLGELREGEEVKEMDRGGDGEERVGDGERREGREDKKVETSPLRQFLRTPLSTTLR